MGVRSDSGNYCITDHHTFILVSTVSDHVGTAQIDFTPQNPGGVDTEIPVATVESLI